jgi:hypothetical protein
VELVKSGGGVFEITLDGTVAFSKKQLHRFPTDDEIDSFAKGGAPKR